MEKLKEVIARGADVNARDSRGGMPLHPAALRGHKDLVELLIMSGADVNAKDARGMTALDLAKQRGHTEVVELLRKHGAKE